MKEADFGKRSGIYQTSRGSPVKTTTSPAKSLISISSAKKHHQLCLNLTSSSPRTSTINKTSITLSPSICVYNLFNNINKSSSEFYQSQVEQQIITNKASVGASSADSPSGDSAAEKAAVDPTEAYQRAQQQAEPRTNRNQITDPAISPFRSTSDSVGLIATSENNSLSPNTKICPPATKVPLLSSAAFPVLDPDLNNPSSVPSSAIISKRPPRSSLPIHLQSTTEPAQHNNSNSSSISPATDSLEIDHNHSRIPTVTTTWQQKDATISDTDRDSSFILSLVSSRPDHHAVPPSLPVPRPTTDSAASRPPSQPVPRPTGRLDPELHQSSTTSHSSVVDPYQPHLFGVAASVAAGGLATATHFVTAPESDLTTPTKDVTVSHTFLANDNNPNNGITISSFSGPSGGDFDFANGIKGSFYPRDISAASVASSRLEAYSTYLSGNSGPKHDTLPKPPSLFDDAVSTSGLDSRGSALLRGLWQRGQRPSSATPPSLINRPTLGGHVHESNSLADLNYLICQHQTTHQHHHHHHHHQPMVSLGLSNATSGNPPVSSLAQSLLQRHQPISIRGGGGPATTTGFGATADTSTTTNLGPSIMSALPHDLSAANLHHNRPLHLSQNTSNTLQPQSWISGQQQSRDERSSSTYNSTAAGVESLLLSSINAAASASDPAIIDLETSRCVNSNLSRNLQNQYALQRLHQHHQDSVANLTKAWRISSSATTQQRHLTKAMGTNGRGLLSADTSVIDHRSKGFLDSPSNRWDQHARPQIVDVWADNLEEEFGRIRDIVERYQYIAMDTEFPGIVARPLGCDQDYKYKTVKYNVDLLKVIQLGITFADERGNSPPGTSTWQFNFKFDLSRDMYAQDSIDFLRNSGIDFETHQDHGIDIHEFGELIISSGLVMNKDVKWISFHGSYDFGYLLKLLTCQPLPPSEPQFFELLRDFFPSLYDIKYILLNCPNLDNGISLQKVAELLDVQRVGPQHQAGSDSLVTCQTFFRLMDVYFDNLIDDSIFSGVIYDLGQAGNATVLRSSSLVNQSQQQQQQQRTLVTVAPLSGVEVATAISNKTSNHVSTTNYSSVEENYDLPDQSEDGTTSYEDLMNKITDKNDCTPRSTTRGDVTTAINSNDKKSR